MSNDSPRPNPEKILGKTTKQSQEATESDLWDLDSDDSDFVKPASPLSEPVGIPARRSAGSSLQSKRPTERQIDVPTVETIKALDNTSEKLAVEPIEKSSENPATKEAVAREVSRDNNQAIEEPGDDKSSPDVKEAKPESPLSAVASLSKIEKIAISCLIAALALGATLSIIHFSNRVPTRPLVAEKIDYPVSGEIVEITAASTHWRTPITTGENADVVRRGTELIPVLKMSLSSKSGAIRVFFRNEEGVVVGDGITRTVKGETELTITATAGFEDIGMHTAYRTGDSPPWVVQVFEGGDAAAPRDEFRMVLETEISTFIR